LEFRPVVGRVEGAAKVGVGAEQATEIARRLAQ
jgi:hypothetical protein